MWHKLVWIDPIYADSIRACARSSPRGATSPSRTSRRCAPWSSRFSGASSASIAPAAERGQIEISTSPFYHPILPLLCDASVYLKTHPSWPPPEQPFAYPQDAAEQLRRAVALHQRLFGRTPVGLWPSEGSVSDAMVPLVADAGFAWMATDEEILARSLPRTFARDADLYRAYQVGAAGR